MGDYDFDCVGHPYLRAVLEGARCIPVLLPTLGKDLAGVLQRVDGLMLTGSLSNVEPHHYEGPPNDSERDPRRDATTLPLIREAIQRGLPLLAICRGHQELNVALGGSLHHRLQDFEDRFDHSSDQSIPFRERYLPRHPVSLRPGVLTEITGKTELQVNSLHHQGIDKLAPGLTVEATAQDGTVEAVRVTKANSFALGIQWHPEQLFAFAIGTYYM